MSFSIFSSNARNFVIAVLALLGLTLALALLTRQAFMATGDLMPEDTIVRMQRSSTAPCIYSNYGKDNEDVYKFELYREARPAIAVIGSSRVLELNARQFSQSFVNLGRLLGSIETADSTINSLLAIHKPEFMIIGLDQYWFSPDWQTSETALRLSPSNPNDPASLIRLVGHVMRESMWREVFAALLSGPECHLGVSAKHFLAGYASDGYRYYGELLTAKTPPEDSKLQRTLQRLKDGRGRFVKSPMISEDRFALLLDLHKKLDQAEVEHVFFLAPYAPSIADAMEKDGGFGYMQVLEKRLQQSGLPHVPLNQIELTDCDFLDGFHGGDAVNARILKRIAEHDQRLLPFLNMAEVNRVSQTGATPLTYLTQDFKLPMRDFLDLGCSWPQTGN